MGSDNPKGTLARGSLKTKITRALTLLLIAVFLLVVVVRQAPDDSPLPTQVPLAKSALKQAPQQQVVDTQPSKVATVKPTPVKAPAPVEGFYQFSGLNIEGEMMEFSRYAGHVTLVVNVASFWGYTEVNYRGFRELLKKYGQVGLEVVAFPCNQFGAQEPGTATEIKAFALQKGFHGTMMDKIDVNGPGQHPAWSFIKAQAGGGDIRWNFEKFLIDKKGVTRKRYSSDFDEATISRDIEALANES